MGKIINWSTPEYSDSGNIYETDSLFYAENVVRYMKFHTPLSVKFCLGDSIRYNIGRQHVVVPAGSYFVVNEGVEMECLPCGPDIKAIALSFTNDLIGDVDKTMRSADRTLLDDPVPAVAPTGFFQHIHRQPTLLSDRMLAYARRMAAADSSERDLPPDAFFGLAEALLELQHDISRQMDRVNARTPATREELFRRVLRAKEFMLDHWNDNLDLAQVARIACLSPYHFHRSFHEAFGQSPMKWFSRYRLERAQALLQNGGVTVTDVALQCGFSDVFTFSRAFKRVCGRNPSSCYPIENA